MQLDDIAVVAGLNTNTVTFAAGTMASRFASAIHFWTADDFEATWSKGVTGAAPARPPRDENSPRFGEAAR